ncbi:hypothetical protein J5X84_00065 [Streptosporangiaceae bacterium NEAU-GS5]|nr:hypothetical protein [Streptosporangiaceae bacterium NEAU-GS5]
MFRTKTLVRLAVAASVAAGFVVVGAGSALACTADPTTGQCAPNPKTYKVSGTDGTLAVQQTPKVDNITRWLHEGDSIQVICQINNGGPDPYDGLTSRTWDAIVGGGWVYDWYVNTSPQGADGFSPGVPHCGAGSGPQPLTVAVSVPNLAIGGIQAAGQTAGPLFNDGPGFTNAGRAESLASAVASGYCQDLVMANTDFSWLWTNINYVARWPQDARANGRTVTGNPVVGSVVVFNPGWHYWSSQHYWDYGDGHVAMVVKVDSTSYTIAEFNFSLGGGGRHILDYRRIPWPDPYPTWGDGASVLGFIR